MPVVSADRKLSRSPPGIEPTNTEGGHVVARVGTRKTRARRSLGLRRRFFCRARRLCSRPPHTPPTPPHPGSRHVSAAAAASRITRPKLTKTGRAEFARPQPTTWLPPYPPHPRPRSLARSRCSPRRQRVLQECRQKQVGGRAFDVLMPSISQLVTDMVLIFPRKTHPSQDRTS